MLQDSARQLFGAHSAPDQVRRAEATGDVAALWQAVQEAGFADAQRPEEAGGAGLHPADMAPVLFEAGAWSVPLPIGQTMLIRGRAVQVDTGVATLASGGAVMGDGMRLNGVPFGRVADTVLAEVQGTWLLLPVAGAQVQPVAFSNSLSADIAWTAMPEPLAQLDGADWRGLGALVTAATQAGAMQRLLELSLAYAGDRVQFGKPIGRQQAIQHQLSLMAEETYAARMAAQIGLSRPDTLAAVAIAKSRVDEAAAKVGPMAHAVHGAIGFTQAHDLHLLTRRLIEGRLWYGSARHWQGRLGRAALDSDATAVEFVQEIAAGKRLPQSL